MAAPLDVITPITIANYNKTLWYNVAESTPICRMLIEKGNINRDQHGTSVVWPIEAGRHDVYTVSDYADYTSYYTPRVRYTQASIAWGEVASFRAISKGELRQNGGPQALVQFGKREIPAMFRDLCVGSNLQNGVTQGGVFWQFWNMNPLSYTGGGNPLYGLPAVFTGNAAITWSSLTITGTINNTNYGGLTCVSGGLSTSMPEAEADAWTPTAFNTTSTGYQLTPSVPGPAGNGFYTNFFEIMSNMISAGMRFSATENDKMIDAIFMTRAMYVNGQTQIAAKQSFLLTGKVGKGAVYGIGSDPQTGLTHNGIPLLWDYLIPAGTAYALNFSQIFIDLLPMFTVSGDSTSQLNTGGPVPEDLADASMFETEVKYNDGRRAVTVSATFPGQIRINPRYQVLAFNGA